MNRLEITKMLVEASGRYDLVTDAAGDDYSDTGVFGANFFLKQASKYLDSYADTPRTLAWLKQDIKANQLLLPLQDVMAVKEVWMDKGEGTFLLEKKPLGWLRQEYPKLSGTSVETPCYWAPAVIKPHSVQMTHQPYEEVANVLTDTFSTSTGWTTPGAAFITSGELQFFTATDGLRGYGQKTVDDLTIGKKYRIQVTIGSYTGTGELSVFLGSTGFNRTKISGDGTHTLYQIAYGDKITLLPDRDFSGAIEDLLIDEIGAGGDNVPSFDLDDVIQGQAENATGIIWMPPADTTYTISVLVKGFSNELISDEDVNFWSSQYPHVLVIAAMRAIEALHRNSQGVADHDRVIASELRGIEFATIEEQISGIDKTIG